MNYVNSAGRFRRGAFNDFRWTLGVAVLVSLTSLGLRPVSPPIPPTIVLVPGSYATTQGSDNGAPVSALDVLDESGLTSNSNEYVQF